MKNVRPDPETLCYFIVVGFYWLFDSGWLMGDPEPLNYSDISTEALNFCDTKALSETPFLAASIANNL